MNGYDLTRNWYNYKFDNPIKVRSIHSDLYFYIIDLWNRLGQKREFGLPTSVTMQLMGIGSYNTYKKTIDDLVAFGFIKIIMESKNQHKSKIIALSKNDKAGNKAGNKALDKANAEATDKPTDSIIKQETKEQETKEQSIVRFDSFWNLYDKKTDTAKCKNLFFKLPEQTQQKILQVVPLYVKKTPDKKFRKNPATWLRGNCWDDDYSEPSNNPQKKKPEPKEFYTQQDYDAAIKQWNATHATSDLHDIQGHLF